MTVGNEVAILYSSSLSIQLWGRHFLAVPRIVWNTLLAAISLGLAWGGRHVLHSIISNSLSLIGYWTICFGVILAIEVFYFRPKIGYDVEGWQDKDRMPVGLAGISTLLAGIGIAFVGMAQTWVRLTVSTSNPQLSLTASLVHWSCGQTNRRIWWGCGQLLCARDCGHALPSPQIIGAEEIRTLMRLMDFPFKGRSVVHRLWSRRLKYSRYRNTNAWSSSPVFILLNPTEHCLVSTPRARSSIVSPDVLTIVTKSMPVANRKYGILQSFVCSQLFR